LGATFERDLCRRWDNHAAAVGLDLPHHPLRARKTTRASETEFALTAEGISTVLWAGGFRPAFGWVEIDVFDDLGFPRTRRGVTDIPGSRLRRASLATRRKSPLLLGVGGDAAHVADAVAAHLETI
jgi:putative flavoprotein involved in K+ transport